MALICRSALLTLASEAFDLLVSFYQALLGQPPQPYYPLRYAEFHLPGLRLGIFLPQADQRQEFQASTRSTTSLCLDVADLEGAIATLTQLGYCPPGPILNTSHGREIYAYDPDGNRLILHEAVVKTS
jgi:predicted enzyme related to lactoylglutathione lyase